MTWYEILCLIGVPSVLVMIYVGIFNAIQHKYKDKKDKTHENEEAIQLLREGMQAMLRDRLRQGYKYYIAQGYIELADKENYDNMYQKYHRLGKNGVMDGMHEEIMQLPTTPRPPRESRK